MLNKDRKGEFIDYTFFLFTILNLILLPTHFLKLILLDMEATMESVGDVRYHPDHRGHQAPGRSSCLVSRILQDVSDHQMETLSTSI